MLGMGRKRERERMRLHADMGSGCRPFQFAAITHFCSSIVVTRRQTSGRECSVFTVLPGGRSGNLRSGHGVHPDRCDDGLRLLLPQDEADPQDIRDPQRQQLVQKCTLTREPLLHQPLQSEAILTEESLTGTRRTR